MSTYYTSKVLLQFFNHPVSQSFLLFVIATTSGFSEGSNTAVSALCALIYALRKWNLCIAREMYTYPCTIFFFLFCDHVGNVE
jgi:hypothetical protein